MSSMTFVQIQNAVLADSFAEAKRADAKNWINFRHAWLWDLEQWTFRKKTAAITLTANSQVASAMPADFRHAIVLYNSQGDPLQPIRDEREFYNRYNANLQNQGASPKAYTVQAGQILLGPQGDGTSGLLIYEASRPSLVNDNDTTGLPDGYDVALVHGGKAEGFKLATIPLWQGFDDDFTAAANALRRNYLTEMRGQVGQMGAFKPRQWG
jgi:hypothetical protein